MSDELRKEIKKLIRKEIENFIKENKSKPKPESIYFDSDGNKYVNGEFVPQPIKSSFFGIIYK